MKNLFKVIVFTVLIIISIIIIGLNFFFKPISEYAVREAGLTGITFEDAKAGLNGIILTNVTVNGDTAVKIATLGLTRSREIQVKDLSATVGAVSISGVNADLKMENLSPPVFANQTITVATLNAGLPLTAGTLEVSMDKAGKITVQKSGWQLAGGTVETSPFSLAMNDITADITLKAQHLDLEKLFQIAPMDGLDATGFVNGTIPIKLRKGNASIVNGVLETSGKGEIRYNPKDPPAFLQDGAGSSLINLRVALSAFNYDDLKLTLNGEAGKMQKVSLVANGHNPGFYDGHAVVLKFNVEGPLQSVIEKTLVH